MAGLLSIFKYNTTRASCQVPGQFRPYDFWLETFLSEAASYKTSTASMTSEKLWTGFSRSLMSGRAPLRGDP